MEEKIEDALLEAIYIMRWNENRSGLTAVLTDEEVEKMCGDIVKELDKAGFKIVKKE